MSKDGPAPLCACGCGGAVIWSDRAHKWNRFIKRHTLSGDKAYRWSGGMILIEGYVFVYAPTHPKSRKEGYVKRATLVAEQSIGRFLGPDELVHHINGVKTDDTPDNLQVMSRSDHMRDHTTGSRNHQVKLAEDDVREIIALAGSESRTVTARRFGVTRTNVYLIQTRKSWAHLDLSLHNGEDVDPTTVSFSE
jgi:hypothetical protein